MLKNKFVSLFLFLVSTFSASFIGGIITLNYKEPWYSLLNKPIFNPPDWIFAPIWTILYFLMSIAVWSAWIKNTRNENLVYLYFIHLFFNTTWSVVFFGFNNLILSFLNLVVLILFIVILIIKYKDISKFSAILMIPYFFWCCFALVLNITLIFLN